MLLLRFVCFSSKMGIYNFVYKYNVVILLQIGYFKTWLKQMFFETIWNMLLLVILFKDSWQLRNLFICSTTWDICGGGQYMLRRARWQACPPGQWRTVSYYTPPQRSWGLYWNHLVRPSVRPSVRRHFLSGAYLGDPSKFLFQILYACW